MLNEIGSGARCERDEAATCALRILKTQDRSISIERCSTVDSHYCAITARTFAENSST